MFKNFLIVFIVAVLLVMGSRVAVTQSEPDLKAMQAEINSLKKNQQEIQKDLEAIKNFLTRRKAPEPFKPIVLNIGDDPFMGKKNAPLTLVDFSDYQ